MKACEEFDAKRPKGMTLAMALEHDQVVAKRGIPSMPKLRFMNGTKWGKDYTDEGSRPA